MTKEELKKQKSIKKQAKKMINILMTNKSWVK